MRRGDGLLSGGNGSSGTIARLMPGQLGTELLRLTGDPGQMQSVAITINTRPVDNAIFPERAVVNLTASVHWGNGVAGGDCLIDLARSTVFTLSAAWTVTVYVNYPGQSGPGVIASGPPYFVEGCAVYGGAASIGPVRSNRLGALATATASGLLPVPAYARRVRIVTTEAVSRRDIVVEFLQDDQPGTLPLYESLQPQRDPGGRDDPIINGAEFYRVRNVDSVATLTNVIAVWELAL